MLEQSSAIPQVRPGRERISAKWRAVIREWPALAAFGLPLLLYVLTAAPTVFNLDSAEFTTAVASGGIVRATGYPLYLLLGKLWLWLPLAGDVGHRMNLFSAFWGAATLFLGDRILRRLTVGPWSRLGALGLLAISPYFWGLSLIAEVYTLHTGLMAGILLLLLRWAQHPSPSRLAWPVLLMALSAGNHAATALLIPGAVWFVLSSHPQELLRVRVWGAGILALLAGAAVFLVLPWRYATQPAFNYAGLYDAAGVFHPVDLTTLQGIWWLISGQTFASRMFAYSLSELGPEIQAYAGQLWSTFLAVGIGPGLLGCVVLFKRNWRLGGFLLLLFLANAAFYIDYRVVDKETMFLPTYLIWALWLGVGYEVLLTWLREQSDGPLRVWHLRLLLSGTVLLALLLRWPRIDLSQDWSTREQSQTILETVEPDALILGWWETIPALQYLQLVEGERPDVTLINRFLIPPEAMHRLILTEIQRRPVYINSPSVALLKETRVTKVGSLYRLSPRHRERQRNTAIELGHGKRTGER